MKFEELKIQKELLDQLTKLEYLNLTEIQEKTIPLIIEGNDIIGQAETGTGKTLAFALPLMMNCDPNNFYIEHLILSPTRELAMQIKDEIGKVGSSIKIKSGLILGGAPYSKEKKMLSTTPNFIVATPGRLLDHLNRGNIDLSHLLSFTLDEADEMLSIGFEKELNSIIEKLPQKRQSLLFSATMSPKVKKIAEKLLQNPTHIQISKGLDTASTITQYAIICSEKQKLGNLVKLMESNKDESAIIFGRTKRRVTELADALVKFSLDARYLHGDMSLKQRTEVMNSFKKKEFHYLVATDVAARGINVDEVGCVYNFDLPNELEFYTHRIGRTGRKGLAGKSITLLRESEVDYLEEIKKATNSQIEIITAPKIQDVMSKRNQQLLEDLLNSMEQESVFTHMELAKQLAAQYGNELVIAGLINILLPKLEFNSIELTSEPPARRERRSSRGGNSSSKKNFGFSRRKREDTKRCSRHSDDSKKDFKSSDDNSKDFKPRDSRKRDYKKDDSKKEYSQSGERRSYNRKDENQSKERKTYARKREDNKSSYSNKEGKSDYKKTRSKESTSSGNYRH